MPSRNILLRKNVIVVTFSVLLMYSLQVDHRLCFTPEAFQPVVFPFFGPKDVHDDVTKV